MTKVIVSEDCGNSPKNIFLQDFTIAFARVDAPFLLGSVTEDVRWNILGGRYFEGKAAFAAALENMGEAAEINIQHVVTHGKAGAVNGLMKTKDGRMLAFCDVVVFGNAKGSNIQEISTYLVDIGST